MPDVLSLYRAAPVRVRAHVGGRWLTCPFPRVAAHVPESGRILDIGCGYGLFAAYLALAQRKRQVLGVDVDLRKIVHARLAGERARAKGATCEFHLSPPGEVPGGPWDAIVLVDVLYLLDADAQEGLLHSCAEQLSLSGVLVVKEMGRSPRWKAVWNRVQETLAVRVLRITEGDQVTVLDPALLGSWMEAAGLTVRHEPIDAGYPHPHHVIVGSRRRVRP